MCGDDEELILFFFGRLERRDHLGNLGADGRIIFKWILNSV
jgi:hypothetical protein